VLAAAIVLWITEAVSYAVSAVLVIALVALLVGLAPPLTAASAATTGTFGTGKALVLAMEGFRSSATVLVSGALVLAAAMKDTGLDRRIALVILSRTGASPFGVVLGVTAVAILLAFLVPSSTARAAALVPIAVGIIGAYGLDVRSRFGALLMMTLAHVTSAWNVAIKTAAGQNLVGVGLMEKAFGRTITWGEWFAAGAPWAITMTVVTLALLRWSIVPEPIGGGAALASLRAQRDALGPLSARERRLLATSLALLAAWASEGWLHPLDSATSLVVALTVLLLPGIGVLSWGATERLVPWGTILLFATGVGLGGALIETGAARWGADATLGRAGVASLPPLAMIAAASLVNIAVHQGFASATSLAAAIMPIMIAFFTAAARPGVPAYGMTLVQLFVVSVGYVLPVNSPQNMLAYGTGAFTTREFVRVGLVLTAASVAVTLLMAVTVWRWIGVT
jgi:anion transporter